MRDYRRILITGGAGFVGANLALRFKAGRAGAEVVAFDNLHRRGSELTLARLGAGGVRFRHGDVRAPEDIAALGPFDLLVDCSAEPSVQAGYADSPLYMLNTNLVGTIHCLEAARRHGADILFLSSSRVYPIAGLRALPLVEDGDRLAVAAGAAGAGWSAAGIATGFPIAGARSLYGAGKLASELLLAEYLATYELRGLVNRCGVLTGPWQFGRVDQGFVTLWAAAHLFGGALRYTGFGGAGRQVRDILHVGDLHTLLEAQLARLEALSGAVFNVGGGPAVSLSLRELTALCAERAGRTISIGAVADTGAWDIPWYVTDNEAVTAATGWAPETAPTAILDDIFAWLRDRRAVLEPLFRPA